MWQRLTSINLAIWVIVGALAGILCGVFFGEYAAVLQPLGSIYVMLLEMAVFPFIISSLLHGLGSLSPDTAWRLLRSAAPYFVVIWAGVFAALWILSLAIPEARPPVVVTAESGSGMSELMKLLIPSNPFTALTENYVPAIVVFSIFYGIAIQMVESKQQLLDALVVFRHASVTIWKWIVLISPIGVFGLFADLAGTVELQLLGGLLLYCVLFVVGALFLALWAIPSVIVAMIPVGYRELMDDLRNALIITMVTSQPVSSVPFVIEAAEKIARQCKIEDETKSDVISTTMAVSYPLAQFGNLFALFFIVFAAYYANSALPGSAWLTMPFVTILSTVGTPVATVDAVGFMGQWMGLPSDTQFLYVELMTLTRYPQVVVSAMGFAFITILVPLAYYGRIKINRGKLAVALAASVIGLGAIAWAGSAAQTFLIEKHPNPYLRFSLDQGLTASVKATVHPASTSSGTDTQGSAPGASGSTMQRVRDSNLLRVGYGPNVIPFSYENENGDLVGYDIAHAYALARDLNVALELYPITDWNRLGDALKANRFDLAAGGIYVTEQRLRETVVSGTILETQPALIVPAGDADRFLSRADLAQMSDIKVAVFQSDILMDLAHQWFPKAKIEVVADYGVLLSDDSYAAAVWTLAQAKAWAEAHSGFSAVVPKDLGAPMSIAFLMPPDSTAFARYVDDWLSLQQDNGFESSERAYWFDGKPRVSDAPRWSIIRNVLHWVD